MHKQATLLALMQGSFVWHIAPAGSSPVLFGPAVLSISRAQGRCAPSLRRARAQTKHLTYTRMSEVVQLPLCACNVCLRWA